MPQPWLPPVGSCAFGRKRPQNVTCLWMRLRARCSKSDVWRYLAPWQTASEEGAKGGSLAASDRDSDHSFRRDIRSCRNLLMSLPTLSTCCRNPRQCPLPAKRRYYAANRTPLPSPCSQSFNLLRAPYYSHFAFCHPLHPVQAAMDPLDEPSICHASVHD